MSSLPMPPSTHPAATTGHVPTDSIGPLPPHLADIGTPERQRSPVYGSSPIGATSPVPAYTSPSHGSHVVSQQVSHTSIAPAQGKTYEQEVNEFLDQTSPARIREQTPTTLPPDSYMAKANHESVTNESSPARARAGSPYANGATYTTAAPYTTTSVHHASPTQYSQPVYHGSPTHTTVHSSIPPVQGKTYEQEVNEYLDQTSPARIREQTPTTLPPDSYMAKANHESVTNESSPARQRSASPHHVSSYQPSPAYQPSHTYQSTSPRYVASASPQQGYVGTAEHIPIVASSPGGADLGSVAPPGPGIPGDGESPRRLRAFGHPHSDPNAPNQSPQRAY